MQAKAVDAINVICSKDYPVIMFDADPRDMAHAGLITHLDAERIHHLMGELYDCYDGDMEDQIIDDINHIVESNALKLGMELPKVY